MRSGGTAERDVLDGLTGFPREHVEVGLGGQRGRARAGGKAVARIVERHHRQARVGELRFELGVAWMAVDIGAPNGTTTGRRALRCARRERRLYSPAQSSASRTTAERARAERERATGGCARRAGDGSGHVYGYRSRAGGGCVWLRRARGRTIAKRVATPGPASMIRRSVRNSCAGGRNRHVAQGAMRGGPHERSSSKVFPSPFVVPRDLARHTWPEQAARHRARIRRTAGTPPSDPSWFVGARTVRRLVLETPTRRAGRPADRSAVAAARQPAALFPQPGWSRRTTRRYARSAWLCTEGLLDPAFAAPMLARLEQVSARVLTAALAQLAARHRDANEGEA